MGRADIPKKVLVVEDDADLRTLAAALLEETDLEVVEAENGDRALAYMAEHADQVALVFTDVVMPGRIDGAQLAMQIARRWPWVRLVVTSGYVPWPQSDLPPGVAFMPKPWRALEVLLQVEQASAQGERRQPA